MVMAMDNLLRIKAWFGLGSFVLQSYEKWESEVESGSTEHTARCVKSQSHQKHQRQSSR